MACINILRQSCLSTEESAPVDSRWIDHRMIEGDGAANMIEAMFHLRQVSNDQGM
jgi:hypothetical protein